MGNNATSELKKRVMADDALYQRYGKKLEQEHKGEFVAISRDGAVIISKSDIEVLQKALEEFEAQKQRVLEVVLTLRWEIQELQNSIDRIVFELYGVSENELG
ncbi:MAG: hypothetical protein AAGB97_00715 [Dehalococcoidia bacterium]|nr:hypothetical protein [Chloroflexota bacterium]